MKYIITNQAVPLKRTIGEGYEFTLVILNVTLNTAKEVESFIRKHASDVCLDFEIDRVEEEINVCGQSFPASFVMRMINPKLYKKMFKEYLKELDIAYEIARMLDGETILMLGFEIRAEK